MNDIVQLSPQIQIVVTKLNELLDQTAAIIAAIKHKEDRKAAKRASNHARVTPRVKSVLADCYLRFPSGFSVKQASEVFVLAGLGKNSAGTILPSSAREGYTTAYWNLDGDKRPERYYRVIEGAV